MGLIFNYNFIMSIFRITITTGFAMFAMFFGSGNLVFPIKIGIQSGNQFYLASLGLLLTGIIVPFLGLVSMVMYQGNREKYFGLLGKWAPFVLSLLMLSLLGPFGVIPRCIIVAYGGISLLWPEISFALFSGVFSVAIVISILQKNKFIPIVGTWLAPFKISGIVLIIIAAINQSPELSEVSIKDTNPVMMGLVEGYQTMDLLASFFFSIVIVEYLRTICSTKEQTLKISLAASCIGALLIAVIYMSFLAMGAYYSPHLVDLKPEQYLATIANLTLGKYATLILAITMFVSCLTTAASLSKLFAEFIQKDVMQSKISWGSAIFITIITSFLLSLTGFATISSILETILRYLYPALIILSISAIINLYVKVKMIKPLFWSSVAVSLVLSMFI